MLIMSSYVRKPLLVPVTGKWCLDVTQGESSTVSLGFHGLTFQQGGGLEVKHEMNPLGSDIIFRQERPVENGLYIMYIIMCTKKRRKKNTTAGR